MREGPAERRARLRPPESEQRLSGAEGEHAIDHGGRRGAEALDSSPAPAGPRSRGNGTPRHRLRWRRRGVPLPRERGPAGAGEESRRRSFRKF